MLNQKCSSRIYQQFEHAGVNLLVPAKQTQNSLLVRWMGYGTDGVAVIKTLNAGPFWLKHMRLQGK